MKRLSFILPCALSAALCFSACIMDDGRRGLHFDQAQYDRELQAWNDSGIKNYTYRVEGGNSSTGPFKYKVVVKGGSAVSVIDEDGYWSPGESMDNAKGWGIATVSQMFDNISH